MNSNLRVLWTGISSTSIEEVNSALVIADITEAHRE